MQVQKSCSLSRWRERVRVRVVHGRLRTSPPFEGSTLTPALSRQREREKSGNAIHGGTSSPDPAPGRPSMAARDSSQAMPFRHRQSAMHHPQAGEGFSSR